MFTNSHTYIIQMKEVTNTMYGNTMKSPWIPGFNIVRFKIGCLFGCGIILEFIELVDSSS